MSDLRPGTALPELKLPPITRHTLALYCGGSGDHNPIHVDIDFAREQAGLDDVIAHGMLVMAYLGRLLTAWAGPGSVRQMKTRFKAPTQVGDEITCRGEITELEGDGVRVSIAAVRQDGTVLADGTALVDSPS
ncbi:MAG: MaoC/PaaZ C-terminal domain-containing protein [Xanthomonadales bacterium]|nr:MaoC/PaaZ C-terminal domain-containing protein [Xanthomonadales bacterium]